MRILTERIKDEDIEPNMIFVAQGGDGRGPQNIRGWKTAQKTEGHIDRMANEAGYELVRIHPLSDSRVGDHGLLQEQYQVVEAFSRIPDWVPFAWMFDQWVFNYLTASQTWNRKGKQAGICVEEGKAPGNVGALAWYAAALMKKYEQGEYTPKLIFSANKFRDKTSNLWFGEWADTGDIPSQPALKHAAFRPREHKDYAQQIELGERIAEEEFAQPKLWVAWGQGCMGMVHTQRSREQMLMSGVELVEHDQGYLAQRIHDVPDFVGERHMDQLVQWGMKLPIDDKDPKKSITNRHKILTGKWVQAASEIIHENHAVGGTIAFQYFMNKLENPEGMVSSDGAEFTCGSLTRPFVFHPGLEEVVADGIDLQLTNERDLGIVIATQYFKTAAKRLGWDLRDCIPVSHDVRHAQQINTDTAYWIDDEPIEGGVNSFTQLFNLSGPMPVQGTQKGYNDAKKWDGVYQAFKDSIRTRKLRGYEAYKDMPLISNQRGRFKPFDDVEATRQDFEYFEHGGICSKARARAGEFVYMREAIIGGERYVFLGRGASVRLTKEETAKIHGTVSDNWPLTLGIMYGRSGDEYNLGAFANHTTTMTAKSAKDANELMFTVAGIAEARGYNVVLCGDHQLENSVEARMQRGESIIGPFRRKAA